MDQRSCLFLTLSSFRAAHEGPLTWIHVASLGEYEQAKPVIAVLKAQEPSTKVVVSFFSPSGYEPTIRKPQEGVDWITYLPLDRKSWAERFVEILQPTRSIFVKYDLWYHHLQALKRKNVPTYLIAASFRPDQTYFSWYGGFFRKMLEQMDWIFTQNEVSVQLLTALKINKVSQTGDTRFDQVAATAAQPIDFPAIREWIKGRPTVVIGSAWEEDMNLLIPLIQSKPEFLWIIAPHAIDPAAMDRWALALRVPTKKYSQWKEVQDPQILFIDNIGMLSSLYQFAYFAYVGGGFGKGLHNILEPLGFGIPVIFGKPRRASKFPEAAQSQVEGCGFAVTDFSELQENVNKLEQPEFYANSVASAHHWVKANLGATDRILDHLTTSIASK
ncbi:MAG: 3-deoxy-D-manno-octulosonic acid transferase [Bacteroidetes bacterium]|nr:3-deoxy-D-manno-octulosonic acid transferase [Bacteroidota bacterium]MDA1267725.1 3-deoxy-D-manno-octulosonic acid transferase [Bacteroidota bacterium]